jgi:hypothetical protein
LSTLLLQGDGIDYGERQVAAFRLMSPWASSSPAKGLLRSAPILAIKFGGTVAPSQKANNDLREKQLGEGTKCPTQQNRYLRINMQLPPGSIVCRDRATS